MKAGFRSSTQPTRAYIKDQRPSEYPIACEQSVMEYLNMSRQFDVVIEKDSEGYFVASVPTLPGCHTQAKSLDELMSRIREAIELYLEVADKELPTSLDFIGLQRVTVAT
jgi:predicted RNase H-like HicB family nuclease